MGLLGRVEKRGSGLAGGEVSDEDVPSEKFGAELPGKKKGVESYPGNRDWRVSDSWGASEVAVGPWGGEKLRKVPCEVAQTLVTLCSKKG